MLGIFQKLTKSRHFFSCNSNVRSKSCLVMVFTRGKYTFNEKYNSVVWSDFGINHLSKDHPWFPRDHKDHHQFGRLVFDRFSIPQTQPWFWKNAEINQLQIISSELKFPLFLCQLFSMIKDVSTDIQLATDNSNGKFLRYRYIGILHLWIYEMGGRSNQQEVIIVLAW